MSRPLAQAGELRDGDLALVLNRAADRYHSPWKVPAYMFRIVIDGLDAGHLNLRISRIKRITHHAGHIGYSVAPGFRGRGYAVRAVRLVAPLAKANGLSRLWITCAPDNAASIRVLEKLGARYVETIGLPPEYKTNADGARQKRRYRLEL
jgi:predicted acetyltransferase